MAQGQSLRSSGESRPRSEYWRGQHEAWQRSGLTQAAFCEEHALSLAAFRWWRWKLKREGSEHKTPAAPSEKSLRMRLVPVRVVDPETSSPPRLSCSASIQAPSSFDVLLGSGTCLRVPQDFDAEALSRLLRTLEAVGC